MKRRTVAILEKHLPKTYAIKFRPGHETRGIFLIVASVSCGGVGLRHKIFLVPKGVLKVLNKEQVKYKKFEVKPGMVGEVIEEARKRGWG